MYKMATIENLSFDILYTIFKNIPLEDAANVTTVCNSWSKVYASSGCECDILLEKCNFKIDRAFWIAMRNKKICVMRHLRQKYYTPRIIAGIFRYIINYNCNKIFFMQVLQILYAEDIIADYNDSEVLLAFAVRMPVQIKPENEDINYNIIKFLIDHGANPAHSKSIILQYFCIKYKIIKNIVRMLVDNGADLQLKGHRFLMTHILSGNKDLTNIKILLDLGVDVNAKNGKPLILAVEFANKPYAMSVTKLLLENGADPKLDGSLALVKAIENEFDYSIIKSMIDKGARL